MRRTHGTVAVAVSTALLLAGCGGGSSDQSDDGRTRIDFAIHVANPQDQEPAFAAVVDAFEAQNPDIDVNLIGKEQSEHIRSIKMQSQSGNLPDMFWMLQASASELNDAGALLDLSDFLNANPDIASSLRPNMVEAFEDDSVQYGLPYQPLVTGLFYNLALFEENGLEVPETFDDLVAASEVFSAKGITTIAQGAKDPYSVWAFLTMLSRFGYFEKIEAILAGDEAFDNSDFVRFYEKIDLLRETGSFPQNVTTQSYFQAVESFTGGQAAMLDSGTWDVKKIEDSPVGQDVGFWWGPTFSDGVGEQNISSVVPSAPIVVNAQVAESEAKLAAIEKFLAFYYGPDGIQLMVDNQVPAMTDVDVSVDETEHPVFASVMEQVSSPAYTSQPAQPDLVVSEAVANAMYDSIYGVINGTYDPQQAAVVVQKAIDNER
ncbi:ABC transporter substrate-binding protein [Oerskovia flava]|uniref:ABC transporter substrate-binding protein n=1 Tax=Oerskovia flava TaxID=2986422 RepID=UPI00223EC8A0|nr:ABC transporter substrate-binding protein [Oerskovia sp. JB1-3-2]